MRGSLGAEVRQRCRLEVLRPIAAHAAVGARGAPTELVHIDPNDNIRPGRMAALARRQLRSDDGECLTLMGSPPPLRHHSGFFFPGQGFDPNLLSGGSGLSVTRRARLDRASCATREAGGLSEDPEQV